MSCSVSIVHEILKTRPQLVMLLIYVPYGKKKLAEISLYLIISQANYSFHVVKSDALYDEFLFYFGFHAQE